ncbi:Calcium-dependent lipid-binding family protein isoform 1 [Hibiscus syriacus]|uniref:Calcium-dependent lipid-binding family protein isoform 1 n=1 Tax=Hibiscus syriacus TaxID=106335 RepID=A0A6A3AYP3_HIBSY|nr:Calcium-dependent lipid-binding family protein isoform 1 [Hibiscus syriacus]
MGDAKEALVQECWNRDCMLPLERNLFVEEGSLWWLGLGPMHLKVLTFDMLKIVNRHRRLQELHLNNSEFGGSRSIFGLFSGYRKAKAFLEHGLPSTQEKLLALMNKAALNVGGIVLNALAIEHFILRHPCESEYGPMDEKEMLLRHAYGLGYPEPNVTFALCRGTWSSPALRIYTVDEVVNELEKAKVDYLEASVGITNKKKISLPKLLQWHMKDFADDVESLLEWIYSQVPRSGSLKRSIPDCHNGSTSAL